jgi:hypothetical protein
MKGDKEKQPRYTPTSVTTTNASPEKSKLFKGKASIPFLANASPEKTSKLDRATITFIATFFNELKFNIVNLPFFG